MKKVFSFLFLVMTISSFAWQLKTGTYELTGSNGNGETYRGYVIIAPQGKNYSVEWRIGTYQGQVGIGVHRDWEDIFSVAFADLTKNSWGVVSYKMGAWGDMEGRWTSSVGTTQGTETLKWINSSTY